MAEGRQPPPQIRGVEPARRVGSEPVVRYRLTVDTGIVDGKRKQLRRRYKTEKEARAALAEIQGRVAAGTYVQPSTLTVEQACADWLRSRHKILFGTVPAVQPGGRRRQPRSKAVSDDSGRRTGHPAE
jgi:integrase